MGVSSSLGGPRRLHTGGDEIRIEHLVHDREGAWDAFLEAATGRAASIAGQILRGRSGELGSTDSTAEVLQESFQRFLGRIRSRPDGGITGDPVHYFLQIVYTQTMDALRRRQRRPPEDLDEVEEPAVEVTRGTRASRCALFEILRGAWSVLTEPQRRLCIAWYRAVRRDGALPPIRELAARVGITEASCWSSLRAIRRKLRGLPPRDATSNSETG